MPPLWPRYIPLIVTRSAETGQGENPGSRGAQKSPKVRKEQPAGRPQQAAAPGRPKMAALSGKEFAREARVLSSCEALRQCARWEWRDHGNDLYRGLGGEGYLRAWVAPGDRAVEAVAPGGAEPAAGDAELLCTLEEPRADGGGDPCVVRPSQESGSAEDAGVLLDLHVAWHPIYRCPALYLNAHRATWTAGREGLCATLQGDPLPLTEAVLRDALGATTGLDALFGQGLLSQEQHPATGEPFYLVHPCKTQERMAALRSRAGGPGRPAAGYVLEWMVLSLPAVGVRRVARPHLYQQLRAAILAEG